MSFARSGTSSTGGSVTGGESAQAVTASTASTTVDVASGNIITLTLNADTTLAFTWPAGYSRVRVIAVQDGTGGRVLTLPTILWDGGIAPKLNTAANSVQVLDVWTPDGGTTVRGVEISRPLARSCRVYNSANLAVANGTLTPLTFDSERWDSDGFHSTSSNTGRITVPAGMGGKYLLSAAVRYAANATGQRSLVVRLNGTTTWVLDDAVGAVGGGANTNLFRSTVITLVAGDYIDVCAYQDSGGSLNVLAADWASPEVTLTLLGA